MRMDELIKQLAAASEITPAKAADEIDKLIYQILKKLRQGQTARIPGLGEFLPGRQFCPEALDAARQSRRRRS